MKDLVNGLIDKANIENNNETKIDSKLFWVIGAHQELLYWYTKYLDCLVKHYRSGVILRELGNGYFKAIYKKF